MILSSASPCFVFSRKNRHTLVRTLKEQPSHR
jgi:hypothetical protein